jgi:AraC-like DNA-binding protein
MPSRPGHTDDFEFQHPGFSAICGKPDLAVAHRHDDLELAVNEHTGGWTLRLMQGGRREDREIVLLEVHARLLRLADTIAAAGGNSPVGAEEPFTLHASEFGLFERILRIVSERYREPLSIPEIARELRVSRDHVMRQFRKVAGITLIEYVTQRRVSCAQRLMITTDEKILDIAQESGFGSLGQFYACFKRITGQAPARYRRGLRR